MNFSAQDFMFGRQRVRQWVPLITQQSRLRHVYQIMGLNLGVDGVGSFYFTLHLTTMCAPFYTSEPLSNPNPKWAELNLINMPNLSASCIVLRIWQHNDDGADKILLTWGVNFSGLCYLGNKISDIQPFFFKKNSVIFYMQGGFYTSHYVIRTDLQKSVPFLNHINLIDTSKDKVMYKRIAIKSNHQEVQPSYNIEKLRRLHHLQVQIRNREADVQNIRDKISVLNGFNVNQDKEIGNSGNSASLTNIRYAPQLLTMNSLNKMMQEKPTNIQKQEMVKIKKEIEIIKFKTKLLSQEKAKKTVIIRNLKQKLASIIENNEERNSDLMENYHKLSRGTEKLKEYKKNLLHHKDIYTNIYSQLQQRRRQLLNEILFIYPMEKTGDDKYTIVGIHLPNSDVLPDSSDSGLSVALGYIAHILIMCSTFLQVPIRYPLTHYGSRSFITDNVSPLLPDKERDFPLFTRGKEKSQFTYAVYLLNKNLAQFRWLIYMNTTDLKATLYNLLTFLQGPRELKIDPPQLLHPKTEVPIEKKLEIDKLLTLRSFSSISNVSDPLLDCIRHERQLERSNSPSRDRVARSKGGSKKCGHGECGRGLSEILTVPEAYMSRQISSDSFRNFMVVAGRGKDVTDADGCCGSSSLSESNSLTNSINITNGKEMDRLIASRRMTSIEQGTDLLATTLAKPIKINSDNLREKKENAGKYGNNRISRSVGSYSDEESSLVLRTNFELGSEPLLNISSEEKGERGESKEGQQEFLEKWLENAPNFACSSEELLSDSPQNAAPEKSPLMARTNALRANTTFNMVRPK